MKWRCTLWSFAVVLFLGIFLFTRDSIAAEVLACPDLIEVQQTLKDQPEGWTSVVDEGPSRLIKISFFDGNPLEKVELTPKKEYKKKSKLYAIWRFDSDTAQNLWVSCSYGRTSMTLVRPVKKKYEQCTVIFDTSVSIGGLPVIISNECR